MLILSRKQREAIQIGDSIEIVVTSIEGGRVRLAISAPREISIQRREVAERAARAAESETLAGE